MRVRQCQRLPMTTQDERRPVERVQLVGLGGAEVVELGQAQRAIAATRRGGDEKAVVAPRKNTVEGAAGVATETGRDEPLPAAREVGTRGEVDRDLAAHGDVAIP